MFVNMLRDFAEQLVTIGMGVPYLQEVNSDLHMLGTYVNSLKIGHAENTMRPYLSKDFQFYQ